MALVARIGNPPVIVFGALIVLVAQLTINMAANVVLPANCDCMWLPGGMRLRPLTLDARVPEERPRRRASGGDIAFNGSDMVLEVDTQVVVHKDIPKPGQPLPIDRRLRRLECLRPAVDSIQPMSEGFGYAVLNQVRREETLTSTSCVPSIRAIQRRMCFRYTRSSFTAGRPLRAHAREAVHRVLAGHDLDATTQEFFEIRDEPARKPRARGRVRRR